MDIEERKKLIAQQEKNTKEWEKLALENNKLSRILKDLVEGKDAIFRNIEKVKRRISENDNKCADLLGENINISDKLDKLGKLNKIFIMKEEERNFLKAFALVTDNKYKYAARNANSKLYLFSEEPKKNIREDWYVTTGLTFEIPSTLFPFIRNEDINPWEIDKIFNLPIYKIKK